MIVVTGGAGLVGSHLVRALNERGEEDILVVDDLTNSVKIQNLRGSRFDDYMDKDEFLSRIEERTLPGIDMIFHQGACTNTMEHDGSYMMDINYRYSRSLLDYSLESRIPFVYASSASVYGAGSVFTEDPDNESALNVYAFSKLQFDRHARRRVKQAESQVVGLRYFNVYGPGESHKGGMASVVYHFYHQYRDSGCMRLFVGSGGFADGAQERDFVWVGDVANINTFFMDHRNVSGVFNVGTGVSRSFNDVALAVINAREKSPLTLAEAIDAGKITYVAFPEGLRDKYQSYTCADITSLRRAGCEFSFASIEEGVGKYVSELDLQNDA